MLPETPADARGRRAVPRWSSPLLLLGLLRALHPGGLLLVGAALATAVTGHLPAGAALERGDAQAAARALTRYTALAVGLPLLALWAVSRATAVVARLRRGEADWLLARPLGRGGALLASWLGTAAGATVWLLLLAVGAELCAGGDGPAERRLGTLRAGAVERLADGSLRWSVTNEAGAPAGARAGLPVGLRLSSGVAATVRLSLERDGEVRVGIARLARAGRLTAELPPGSGGLTATLSSEGGGAAPLVVGRDLELLDPHARERDATLAVAARFLWALVAWTALALGVAAWTSGPTAAALWLSVWTTLWLADRAASWVPGADLPAAVADVAEGRVPASVPIAQVAGALLLAGVGLAAARAGLAPGRLRP